MELVEILKNNDYRVILLLGAATWALLSIVSIVFMFKMVIKRSATDEKLKDSLKTDSTLVKSDIHDIRNYMNSWNGKLDMVVRDMDALKKNIRNNESQIIAISTALHIKGIMPRGFTEPKH